MTQITVVVNARSGKSQVLAVPATATVAQLQAQLSNKHVQVMSLAMDGCVPSAATTVADLYTASHDADGAVHVSVAAEKPLGSGSITFPTGLCGETGNVQW